MKKPPKKLLLQKIGLGLLLGALMFPAAYGDALNLEEFLKQVQERHQGYKGAQENKLGSEEFKDEAKLLLSPTLYGQFQTVSDKKLQTNPAFMGTKTQQNTYTLGVSQLTTFGLQAKLSYSLIYTKIDGVPPAFLPQNPAFDARPSLELTQSLGSNFFGRSTRYNQVRHQAEASSKAYGEAFKMKAILAEAETAYWRLALAKALVRSSEESLERTKKIRDWNERRAKMSLGDRSDYLQASALVEIRELELDSARNELRSAEEMFNTVREVPVETSVQSLQDLDASKVDIQSVLDSGSEPQREDVKSAQQATEAARASYSMELEKLLPSVDAFGGLTLNGRSSDQSTATGDSFTYKYPTWVVGLKFTAPLDVPTLLVSRSGVYHQMSGADLQYQRKTVEVKQEWEDLRKKLKETKRRLELAQSIERIQEEKLKYEKKRHTQGRTTTYQVLNFEQDFQTAQVSRLKLQAEALQVIARIKTYR